MWCVRILYHAPAMQIPRKNPKPQTHNPQPSNSDGLASMSLREKWGLVQTISAGHKGHILSVSYARSATRELVVTGGGEGSIRLFSRWELSFDLDAQSSDSPRHWSYW